MESAEQRADRWVKRVPEFMRADMKIVFLAGWAAAMSRVKTLDKIIATGEQG